MSREYREEAKAAFRESIRGGDIFVTGREWEWNPSSAPEAATAFLSQQAAGIPDVARYFDVPADMIDAAVSGQSVTYANISQRNLQLLITSLGPAVQRREARLSAALPAPRFCKLNTDAMLRLDPEARSRVLGQQVRDRLRTPTEARRIDDFEPYGEADFAEFDRLFGSRQVPTTTTGVPA